MQKFLVQSKVEFSSNVLRQFPEGVNRNPKLAAIVRVRYWYSNNAGEALPVFNL